MLKKIGFPVLALAAMLALVPPQKASAAVRFGVVVGGPVYTAPVPAPVYPAPCPQPYVSGYYSYPAPAYVAPYFGWHGRDGRVWHERERVEHRDHVREERAWGRR